MTSVKIRKKGKKIYRSFNCLSKKLKRINWKIRIIESCDQIQNKHTEIVHMTTDELKHNRAYNGINEGTYCVPR